jgi:dihydrofolate reductase / thymidylate synthase
MFNIILATDSKNGIGNIKDQKLPWDIKEDILHFYNTTYNANCMSKKINVLIMGRKTADTLKTALKYRINVVLTSNSSYRQDEGFLAFNNINSIIKFLQTINFGKVFVIGGGQIISKVLEYPCYIDKIYLTKINRNYNLDIKINSLIEFINKNCTQTSFSTKDVMDKNTNENINITFNEYQNNFGNNKEEVNYLNIMKELIFSPIRSTRNSNTYSQFGETLEFNLQNGFPALTTKKLFWRGVVEELLFFLSGSTDNKLLNNKQVHIWDSNTTQEFIDQNNLGYQEGDMGPMYGYQWRHCNCEYIDKNSDYTDKGIDQFRQVIDLILNNPTSRRILMTTYSVPDAKKSVLYPCHGLTVQFYVNSDNNIDCQMYQRSADWFLGVPFNIASYALLLHIIVNHVNYISTDKEYSVGKLKMIFGDYHLYETHIDQALEQLSRIPKKFPSLEIKKNITSIDTIFFKETLKYEDFILHDYKPYKSIKADMVA